MTTKIMKGINIIVVFLLSAILWILGTIVGVFFLGLYPSTYALLYIFNKDDLFESVSYVEIFVSFWKAYKKLLKKMKWRVLVTPTIFIILTFDFLIVRQSELIRSIFQWPLIFLFVYFLLVSLSYLVQEDKTKEKYKNKLKFSMVVPFVLPLEITIISVFLLSLIAITIKFSWFAIFGISIFLYVVNRLLTSSFAKKELIKN